MSFTESLVSYLKNGNVIFGEWKVSTWKVVPEDPNYWGTSNSTQFSPIFTL